MEEDNFKQLMPPTGDWFCVTHARDSAWWIERISAFALTYNGYLSAFGKDLGRLGEDGHCSYFVYGPDKSPMGPTWNEIYDQAEVNRHMSREITEIVGDKMSG